MRAVVVTIFAAAALMTLAATASAQWETLGQDPQLWPYCDTDTPPPDQNPTLDGLQWNVNASWVIYNTGKIWSIGGVGTDYTRPEGGTYWGNRQSKTSYYRPGEGWTGSFGGTPSGGGATGPVAYNNGNESQRPIVGDGTSGGGYGGKYTAFASYGVKIFTFGGYPRWGANADVYDTVNDRWYIVTGNPDTDVYAHGVQIGELYYHLNGDGSNYDFTVFNLTSETWSQGSLFPELVKDSSVGYTGSGNHVAITLDASGAYHWQDMDALSSTAFANNPSVMDSGAELVVYRNRWLIQISHQGNVQVYDLSQGPTGTWSDTGIGPPSDQPGTGAAIYGPYLYWQQHGNLGDDNTKGMLYRISITDPIEGLGLPAKLSGDVDDNGVVDGLDLTAVISAWQSAPGDANWNEPADLDLNLTVDGLDLTEVISNWGSTEGATAPFGTALPEPASIMFLLPAGGIALFGRKRGG